MIALLGITIILLLDYYVLKFANRLDDVKVENDNRGGI